MKDLSSIDDYNTVQGHSTCLQKRIYYLKV